MFDELEAVGVRLLEYNPLAPWKKRFALGKLTRRDHRKILIVDGRVGFTGGINLGDEWASERDGGKAWRDDLVRVEGPAVEGFLECFHQTWSREGGALLRHFEHAPSEPADGQNVRVLGENRFANRRQIRRAYLLNIYRARETIWITNAYFVPERSVVRALERAATRGVDVRVLLPGESDVEVVRHASRAVWSRLMRRGVRIYEYQKRILHAKSAVIDGIWSTIGTFNLDHLSVRSNLEVNVAVHDQSFGRLMQTRFLTDLDGSLEIDPRVHRFRSLGDRLLERLLYAFRRFM
jgi:cardiolipin synthase